MAKTTVGTKVKIVDEGLHFFPLGETVIINEVTEDNHGEGYYARGMTRVGITATQIIRPTDFVLAEEETV